MLTDSKRLDWVERHGREVWKDDRVFVVLPDGNPLKCWSGSGHSLREAIDDAMAKNKPITIAECGVQNADPKPAGSARERLL